MHTCRNIILALLPSIVDCVHCMVWSKAHIYTIIAWICYNWYLVILWGGSIKFSKPLCGCDGPWRLASEGLANSYASELVLQLVEFVVDWFCWVRLTFHIVLCIFTKDSGPGQHWSPQTTFHCQSWSWGGGGGILTVESSPVVLMVIPLDPYQ